MLQDIITDNSYPIVFIGSGISKRYLKNFPTWEELLKGYWLQIGETDNFYSHLRAIKSQMEPSLTEEEKDFNANTMKCPHPHHKRTIICIFTEKSSQTKTHFFSRLVRKGHRKYSLMRYALFY